MIFDNLYVKLCVDKINERGTRTMKKNQIIVLSVILSVIAATVATVLLLKHLSKKKKNAIAAADLAFETDFDDFDDFEDLDDLDEEEVVA